MILTLSIILLCLLLFTGGKRGLKTFISFYVSFILICIYVILMGLGLNAIITSVIICICAVLLILFLINGSNIKSISSLISIIIVLLFTFALCFITVKCANIAGYSEDSVEVIGGYNSSINYSMSNVLVGMFLLSVVGTIVDTSISVSSALYEVYDNNLHLTEKELFLSGMNIGRDILSTTINTLFFALVINFIGFLLWHHMTSISYILNYKAFSVEVINLLICFISSILIIPITAFISSRMFKRSLN